jgi:competence protein ComEC
MPMIVWVFLASAGGLLAGFSFQWPYALFLAGVLAIAAAYDRLPPPLVLYFGAGAVLALTSARPMPFAAQHRDPTSLGERLRLRASDAIDRDFGDDAPLAKALLVADQSEIPRDVKARYADAGIIHMLSISGLHVTVIAGSLVLMLQLARIPVRMASFGSAAGVMCYVFILGFPPSAVRAAVMVTVAAIAHGCQRHTSRWCVLALGALAPLVDPLTVLNLGYQLSVGGMAALIAAAQVRRRVAWLRARGWRAAILKSLFVSAIATVVTAPLVAASFGRLSLIGPLANLVADPIIALAQPMLFLALLLAPWPTAARFVAAAAHPLLVAFERVATLAAAVPFAAIPVTISQRGVVFAVVAAGAMLVACASRFPARAAVVAFGAGCATVWLA